MTTNGIELLYLETHNWGKSVAFWQTLGFKLEFETDHHSGVLVAANGTRIFLAEQAVDDPVGIDIHLGVTDAEACHARGTGGARAALHRHPLGHPGDDRARSRRASVPARSTRRQRREGDYMTNMLTSVRPVAGGGGPPALRSTVLQRRFGSDTTLLRRRRYA